MTAVEEILHSTRMPEYARQITEAAEIERARRERFIDEMRENQKTEFINGEVIVHSPAKYGHVLAIGRLLTLLRTFAAEHKLGVVTHEKTLVSLTRNDYEPDINFWRAERAAAFTEKQMRFPAPDMVVEVLSPSTQRFDSGVKFEDYALHGVSEYWIVDTDERTVEQYLLHGNQYELAVKVKDGTLASVAMAGLRIPVAAIFDEEAHGKALREILGV